MASIRAVIVEDEVNNRVVLEESLKRYIPDVEVVGYAENVNDGIKVIRDSKPELVFLDIEIDGGTSFGILNKFNQIDFTIIFITAYDHYAIKAIKYSAFDYLLKPLDVSELEDAVNRYRETKVDQGENLEHLKGNLKSENTKYSSIMISTGSGYLKLEESEIICLVANGNYVTFVLANSKKYLVSKSLAYYEEMISTEIFCRIHKSHIVNMNFVVEVESGRTGKLRLSTGELLDVAARRKSHFMKRFKEFKET